MTDPQAAGRSPYREEGDGHEFRHPQDVYATVPGRPPIGPVFTIRCSCACHR
ncbi:MULTISPECIES: hypothetical protein [Streptomyces]|uniref:Uncharacterized protein n=2 Tax=Streptomyces sudanensis TaxID=436397 RepID=A0ABY4TAY8_9ACTN|nr:MULTISPECIES: hypothetical protein [Streptomyces]URN16131.1 hypothetical protein MW084_09430 [Streptomyces sudanensis]